jgi:hypothetical protein
MMLDEVVPDCDFRTQLGRGVAAVPEMLGWSIERNQREEPMP